MRLSTTFVPVRKIKPSVSRWNFSEEIVEQAARLVTKVEGIISPLVLRRESNSESYQVMYGNFEYYVAARASELEPRICETIAAFIIEPEDEAIVQEQINLFRYSQQFSEIIQFQPASDLESRLKSLELRQADLEFRQRSLEMQKAQTLSSGTVKQQMYGAEQSSSQRANLLAAFNDLERTALLQYLRRTGLTGRNAEKIVEMIEDERQRQPFGSLKEVVTRIKGLTYEKMVDLIEVL